MIERRQKPPQFASYRRYKPFLRLDFNFRCAYCGITEYRWGSDRNFVVEHFRPKVRFPRLICAYSNLYYACNRCNDLKGDTWPTRAEIRLGFRWADPCQCDPYVEHMQEREDGTLLPLSKIGEFTSENLLLNLRPYLVDWRRERRLLLNDIASSKSLVTALEAQIATKPGNLPVVQLSILIAAHRRLCARLLLEY